MLSYFMGCIALVRCVLVLRVVWLQPASGYHTTPTKPHITPTHIIPEQYNTAHEITQHSTYKSQAPEDGCINIRNMLSIK